MKHLFSNIAILATASLTAAAAAADITSTEQLTDPVVVTLSNTSGQVIAADTTVSTTATAPTDDSNQWVIYNYRGSYYFYNLSTKGFLTPNTYTIAATDDTDAQTVETATTTTSDFADVCLRYVGSHSGWLIDCGSSLLGLSSNSDQICFLETITAASANDVIFNITPSTTRTLTDAEKAEILAAIEAQFKSEMAQYQEFLTNESTFEKSSDNLTGYAGGYDVEDLTKAVASGSLAEAEVAYQKALVSRLPKAGRYYRIANWTRPTTNVMTNYLHINTEGGLYSSGLTTPGVGATSNSSQENLCLFTFEFPNGNPYQVKVKVAATDTYLNGGAGNGYGLGATATVDNAVTFTLEPAADFAKRFRFKKTGTDYWLTSSGAYQLVAYNQLEESEQWYFEEVDEISDIALNSGGYALIQLPCPVEMPSDVEFYAADYVKADGTVVMEQIGGTVLAANTPVLIHYSGNAKTRSAATSLTLAISSADLVDSEIANNMLSGTNVINSNVSTSYMTLADGETPQLTQATATTIQPNSAYLESDATSAKVTLSDAILTGMTDLDARDDADADRWYDLDGRRVLTPSNGLYINGTRHRLELRSGR
jgi:hypothetical protein